jgi:hypothetical protein
LSSFIALYLCLARGFITLNLCAFRGFVAFLCRSVQHERTYGYGDRDD